MKPNKKYLPPSASTSAFKSTPLHNPSCSSTTSSHENQDNTQYTHDDLFAHINHLIVESKNISHQIQQIEKAIENQFQKVEKAIENQFQLVEKIIENQFQLVEKIIENQFQEIEKKIDSDLLKVQNEIRNLSLYIISTLANLEEKQQDNLHKIHNLISDSNQQNKSLLSMMTDVNCMIKNLDKKFNQQLLPFIINNQRLQPPPSLCHHHSHFTSSRNFFNNHPSTFTTPRQSYIVSSQGICSRDNASNMNSC